MANGAPRCGTRRRSIGSARSECQLEPLRSGRAGSTLGRAAPPPGTERASRSSRRTATALARRSARSGASRRSLGDHHRQRSTPVVTQRALAVASGTRRAHLPQNLATRRARRTGVRAPRRGARRRLRGALRPSSGSSIRDRLTRADAAAGELHPRWHAFTEVAVRHGELSRLADGFGTRPREMAIVASECRPSCAAGAADPLQAQSRLASVVGRLAAVVGDHGHAVCSRWRMRSTRRVTAEFGTSSASPTRRTRTTPWGAHGNGRWPGPSLVSGHRGRRRTRFIGRRPGRTADGRSTDRGRTASRER